MDEFVANTRTLVRSVPDPERFNDFEPQAVHPRSRIEERTFELRSRMPRGVDWAGESGSDCVSGRVCVSVSR